MCIGDLLPTIYFKTASPDPGADNVRAYTVKDNVVDTIGCHFDHNYNCYYFQPFDDYVNDAGGKLFIVQHNGKQDTIYNVSCEFKKEKIKCNECFMVFKEKETVNVYHNFFFAFKNNHFQKGDTLLLN
jgi:hypothetical protein